MGFKTLRYKLRAIRSALRGSGGWKNFAPCGDDWHTSMVLNRWAPHLYEMLDDQVRETISCLEPRNPPLPRVPWSPGTVVNFILVFLLLNLRIGKDWLSFLPK